MRVPWELALILALLIVVATAVQQAAPERAAPAPPDLASDSAAPGGALGLYLWLQSLGYRVERLEYRDFRPGEDTRALLMLAPTTAADDAQLAALRRWVEQGGTLIVAGRPPLSLPNLPVQGFIPGGNTLSKLLGEFALEVRALPSSKTEAKPSQPLLLRPAVNNVRVEAAGYVTGTASLVTYLGESEQPVAAALSVGRGRVYVLASAYTFSNLGLREADNAALALNWLPPPGDSVSIAFDEIHHGRAQARSLLYELVHQPWGWAVIYALATVFLYLLLDGRRFGRPVPIVVDTRRAAAEYVASLASLLRRSGKRDWVARHYEVTLRRQLAVACDLDPALDTAVVVARLSEMGRLEGGVDSRDAGRVLRELHHGANAGVSEGHLVRLAAEADRIMKACGGRRR